MKTPPKPTAASSGVSKVDAGIEVRVVEPEELARFESLLKESHYLGPAPPVGDFLRQVALRNGQWVGLLVWGPAAYKLKDRERWIGWSVPPAARAAQAGGPEPALSALESQGSRTQF